MNCLRLNHPKSSRCPRCFRQCRNLPFQIRQFPNHFLQNRFHFHPNQMEKVKELELELVSGLATESGSESELNHQCLCCSLVV